MFQQGNFTVDDTGNMYINGQKVNFNQTNNNQPKQKTILDMYMGPIVDVEFKETKIKEETKEEN